MVLSRTRVNEQKERMYPRLGLGMSVVLNLAQALCLILDPQTEISMAHVYFDAFTVAFSAIVQVSLSIVCVNAQQTVLCSYALTTPQPSQNTSKFAQTLLHAYILIIFDICLRILRFMAMCSWEVHSVGRIFHTLQLVDLLLYSTACTYHIAQVRKNGPYALNVVLWMKVMMGEIKSQVKLLLLSQSLFLITTTTLYFLIDCNGCCARSHGKHTNELTWHAFLNH